MSGENTHFVGKVVRAVAARVEEKETEPPDRYSEDTLVADMVNAYKFAKNDQERATLRETEGLGTSRTREPTITNLKKRGMLVSTKKKNRHELTSSPQARAFISGLPDALTSVATTAKWEVAFKMVERGQVTQDQIRKHLRSNLNQLMVAAKDSKGKISLAIGNSGSNLASSRNDKKIDVKTVFAKKPLGNTPVAKPANAAAPAKGIGSAIKKWF